MYVCFLIGTPGFVACLECMLRANDFSFEKRGQGGMVFCEACEAKEMSQLETRHIYIEDVDGGKRTLNAQVTAQVGLGHIHVLNLHVNIVHLTVRLLCPNKSASGTKKG